MSNAQPPRQPGAEFTTAIFARIGMDRYTVCDCVLGPVYVGWSVRGVSAVRLVSAHAGDADFRAWFHERIGRRVVAAVEPDGLARAAQAQLAGDAVDDVPIDLEAADPFERSVLERVRDIRSGHARPYELLAREVATPCTPQSVAGVLERNAVPLLIPCHRVVCEDRCCGSSYVFGADTQVRLLALEGLDPVAVDSVVARGIRYIENDGWFCLPTCGDIAGKIDMPGYGGLFSATEAITRGLRACESCRPLAAA